MNDSTAEHLGDLRRKASLKLAVTVRQLRRHFDRGVAELGVTRSQWMVITVVSSVPGATQRAIAQALEISEASAGRLVDRLCAEGLVERRPKDDDRRAHCVYLTASGQAVTDQLAQLAKLNEAAAFKGFADEDLERLNLLLDRITANLGKSLGGEGMEKGPHG